MVPPPGGRKKASRKVIQFRHVRINAMHARLTYEGYPITVTDFGLVLDPCVYRGMEGSWKTIFNK